MKAPIYRIQDAEGRGPWRPGFSSVWSIRRSDHLQLAPMFVEFPGIEQRLTGTNRHYGCGCLTLSALRRWFVPQEYETLLRHGYYAARFDGADIVASSEIQAVFSLPKPLRDPEQFRRFDLYPARRWKARGISNKSARPHLHHP